MSLRSPSMRSALFFLLAVCGSHAALRAEESSRSPVERRAPLEWLTDYGMARDRAIAQEQMLLIYFHGGDSDARCEAFEEKTLLDLEARWWCEQYVRVRIPVTETISVEGKKINLLHHPSFAAMEGRPGLAAVDFQNSQQPHYRQTVGCLPFKPPVYFAPPFHEATSVRTFLELPPGTLTQRMIIYAVRMHPETPASTQGTISDVMTVACTQHSRHQAAIRRQGHHNWESRFHRIWRRARGKQPTEVCAESWPGKSLVDACFDCVHSWRQSSGHWRAVHGKHPRYGYDIARGSNGIWYATGIFGGTVSPMTMVSRPER